MLGEHDYQDKRWMLEQSQRMPLMIRYPKVIKAGQRFDTLVENVDFAPTLLEFAGATIPATVQGRSFWPLLESGREPDDWKKERSQGRADERTNERSSTRANDRTAER